MKERLTNKQEIPNLNAKNSHIKIKIFSILLLAGLIALFIFLFVALAKEYKDTHTFNFQSPIVLRTPVIIKRDMTIVSPISTQSGIMKAYAAEVKNPYDVRSPKGIGWELVKSKWGTQEWGAFEEIITRESGWHNWSINSDSGACGLGQALPCSKMGVELWDYEGQLKWTVDYIANRYGTPSKALDFHNDKGWY